jgi:hypothetical protein
VCDHVAKANRAQLDRINREVDARAKGMAQALNRILLLWAEREVRDAVRNLGSQFRKIRQDVYVSKAAISRAQLERQLMALFRQFGLRQFNEAGKLGAKQAGGTWAITPELAASYNDTIESKVKLLIRDTEAEVKRRIQRIVSDSLREDIRPSQAEVGRRIARSFMGPPTGTSAAAISRQEAWPGRGTPEERRVTADWARSHLGERDREYIFDFQRAKTIARNEIANAENAGIAEGYAVAGVEWVEWLAYTNDGRSGKREHWKMNKHKPITVADMQGTDRSKWFRLPSGERTPRPKWHGLSAGESISCRCVLVPAKGMA